MPQNLTFLNQVKEHHRFRACLKISKYKYYSLSFPMIHCTLSKNNKDIFILLTVNLVCCSAAFACFNINQSYAYWYGQKLIFLLCTLINQNCQREHQRRSYYIPDLFPSHIFHYIVYYSYMFAEHFVFHCKFFLTFSYLGVRT